jgi:hypothetical protein
VPTSASKSIIPRAHCAFPIAMEMPSSSCKRKARNKKKLHLDFRIMFF